MGCTNTKVHGIASDWHTFDQLPVEILYRILDELDISTIFQSVYHVCKRLDEILYLYDDYHLNLKLITLKHLHLISLRIRPQQITKLTLIDDETNPGLLELFLTKYSMNSLTRLRSLTLMQINSEETINQILIPIADETSLLNFSSITLINADETYSGVTIELLMAVLTKPSLRKAYLDISYSRTTSTPLPWLTQSSVRHLTLIGTCAVSFLRNVFIHTPQLETLITDDCEFYSENALDGSSDENDDDDDDDTDDSEEVEIELNANVNNEENPVIKKEKFATIQSTDCLKFLSLTSLSFTMSKLQWLLDDIPTLKQFHLITMPGYDDESILDGSRWEKFISNLEKFQFVFSVSISDSPSWNIDTCLSSFGSSFWTDKQWFISIEKYDDMILLYSLPYLDKNYVFLNAPPSFEYRSTVKTNSMLQIEAMKNVRNLYIDTSEPVRNPIENLRHPRFCHITNMILHGKWTKSDSFFTGIQTVVDLSVVKELNRTERIPTADAITLLNLLSNLQCLRTNTTFLDALNAAKFSYSKCLQYFIIDSEHNEDDRPVNIEPFCTMFPRIQHLNIPVDSVESCKYVLEQLKDDLVSVVFQIPDRDGLDDSDDSDDDDDTVGGEDNSTVVAFAEWIKDLPKEYHSFKRQRYVHISLK
ncbi:unnamed protein product [Adineta ricciae]|uniref:F-box domain-containing protein n=1 Tax=Adineta ricciae TaxID=249248 RepID=A0A816A9P7_ADIRI|nr:unnamed protein product [Adineta ricciae]